MKMLLAAVVEFFRAPALEGEARRTYRWHLAFTILDAVAGGIVANAPFIALKAMGAPVWQLGLNITMAGAGMLATLYLGSRMATRPKMPFVFWPGMGCALAGAAMSLTHDSLLFLFLGGLGLMFSTITRPPIAAIVRTNYPATHRGQAVGEIRKWSSLVFLSSFLVSARTLDLAQAAGAEIDVARLMMALCGLTSFASYTLFRRIRVQEDCTASGSDLKPRVLQSFRAAADVVARDGRFRRYLLGCGLFWFAGFVYKPYIPKFLSEDLLLSYVMCAMLLHVVPSLAAFVTTGLLGRWFDRANPWKTWAWLRFGWGLDPLILAATPFCLALAPSAALALPVLARVSVGAVQGGTWILWWQVGVDHFAKPGGDTSRYQGILAFLYGLVQLTAPAVGAWILAAPGSSLPVLFAIGGVGVLLSGLHCLWEARREKSDPTLATVADFEARFGGAHGGAPAETVGERAGSAPPRA